MSWRLLPVLGLLTLAGCSDSGAAGDAAAVSHPGEDTYNRYCFSCHAGGVAGAPKFGDAAAWAPRIAKGQALLLKSSREGVPPGMPPMGLCNSCSTEELDAAVNYMVQAAQ